MREANKINGRIKNIFKIVACILMFVLTFLIAQLLLVPKFFQSSTAMWENIYSKSVEADYFFMGSSEVYCSIDSVRLTDEYEIKSYDLGSGGAPLFATEYYLKELLKYQKPSNVIIDTATIFRDKDDVTEQQITWAYAATRPSSEKVDSLNGYYDNYFDSFVETYFPLFKYHSRWSQLEKEDFGYFFLPLFRVMSNSGLDISFIKDLREKSFNNRGFVKNTDVREVEIAFLDDSTLNENDIAIPSISNESIRTICDICSNNNINLLFIKTPTTNWTKQESIVVKDYFSKLDYDVPFVDFHDNLEEIGIDAKTDFYDSIHLNYSGATKFTTFLASYLLENNL